MPRAATCRPHELSEHVQAEPAGPDLGPPALKPLDWERERLQAVRDCRQLDDAAEARFGTILSLVESVFKVG